MLIALCDLAGVWQLSEVTAALTRFADAAVNAALDFLLRHENTKGNLRLADLSTPAAGCGYAVIAMGKMGAFELNYSSDIDIIVLYEPQSAPLAAGIEPSTFFVKLTRSLVSLLQDVTEDGYVFRVDLRLRPDPRATQVAIAIEAAANYYEYQGQNWERAAMIKARACAGDIMLGKEFLTRLQPYIWRKYLDYAAIADVQSMKRQIHAVKGHAEVAVEGHDLKLGRGGIREIEFFVQTQQLIAGGKNPSLRGSQTLQMLDQLASQQWITGETAADLKAAYIDLRSWEHRAQMVDDLQTHLVPASPEKFLRYAAFCGFADPLVFADKIRATLETVQTHYAALFEDAEGLGAEGGNLVFTGGDDDPATLKTLIAMGFADPAEVAATIRAWHFGRYPAMRAARAREVLTELVPALLRALAATGEPQQAFLAFDNFLKSLPAGVQLLAMMKANPRMLDLMAQIMGSAPRLAAKLSERPRILEAVVAPRFFQSLPSEQELQAEFDTVVPAHTPRDDAMDRLRVLAREHQFRIGVRVLSETLDAPAAGQAYAAVAQTVLAKLLAVVAEEVGLSAGNIDHGRCVVLGLGKLGGFEMTAGSDLDLMLIYDHPETALQSDGAKPLSPSQYYARLTQRLVTALTAPTAEGSLYEVDMRLRPSGSKGPLAVSLKSFESYQTSESWTWEKMALTRARVVAGDTDLGDRVQNVISQTLRSDRDPKTTREDVAAMRTLMLHQLVMPDLWELKKNPGGQIDVEFIAQYLQLISAGKTPAVLDTNTQHALSKLQIEGILSAADHIRLSAAQRLYERLSQMLRLCVQGTYRPQSAPARLNQAMARLAHTPDLKAAEAKVDEMQASVHEIFHRIIGDGNLKADRPDKGEQEGAARRGG